jgi:hypothetical protein
VLTAAPDTMIDKLNKQQRQQQLVTLKFLLADTQPSVNIALRYKVIE